MSNRKEMFTPGPWRWIQNILEQNAGEHDNVFYAEAEPLDDYGSWHALLVFEGNEEADRALIAAAPELYGALKAFVDACTTTENPGDYLKRMEACVKHSKQVLAKALGTPSIQEDGK